MIDNRIHLSSCMFMFSIIHFLVLVVVESANVTTEVPNATVSTDGSFLIDVTERPQPQNEMMSEVLNDLKCARSSLVDQNYNRIFHPPPTKGSEERTGYRQTNPEDSGDSNLQPTIVRIIVDILRVVDIDEHEEIVLLLLKIKQFWTDSRIKPPPEYIAECSKLNKLGNESVRYLPAEVSKTIWFPDLYLNRVEELHISKVLVDSSAVRINGQGDVEYTLFGKFKVFCGMNFVNFPLDVQYCPMYVESWRIRTTEQDLMWDPEHPIGLLSDYNIDQFSLSVVVLRIKKIRYTTGSFARIGFVIVLSRKLPFYLLQIYLPTVLFVIISWLTFFIPPPYAQGRIILTITTLLALTALNSIISKHSPTASYLRGIDVWMQGCFFFVFVAIVDCLVDIRLVFVVSQAHKQQNPSFLLPVSVALVENRQVFDDLFGGRADREDSTEPDATPSIYSDAPEAKPSATDLPEQTGTGGGKRVSFVDELTGGTTSLVSPQLQRVESGPLALPEARPDPSEELERRAIMFEKMSIIVYPALFALFNVCYWGYYLNASRPPDSLAAEISGGFTPPPL